MTFYWGKNVTVLFDFWKTNTWTSYALTLLSCFLFSLFYQYLEDRRIAFKSLSFPVSSTVDSSSPLLSSKQIGRWNKLGVAAIFGVNSALGYMLMLSVMSFNGGVFLSVVFGLSVGYFLFRCSDEAVAIDNPCACA